MSTTYRRIKVRRGLAASSPTEVPRTGEFCFETDTENATIGDGVTAREDLDVFLKRIATETFEENRVALGGAVLNQVKTSPAIRSNGAGQLILGLAGTTGGEAKFENATSGSIVVKPVTGALGTRNQTLPARDGQIAIGGLFDQRLAKTGAYTVVAADRGKVIDATSGTWSLALTAAATLGDGFSFGIFNSGSGVITIDPDSAETIRDSAGSAATKTLAQGEGGIVFCDGTGWMFLKTSYGSVETLISLGAIFNLRLPKTGAYTVVLGDKGKCIDTTSGTFSLSLDPAATLGDGFNFVVFNSGSGVITIDPNGAETIRDATGSAATKTLAQGESGFVVCDGTGFLFIKTAVAPTAPTLASLGGLISSRAAKTGAYTVVVGDRGKVIEATSGTWTLGLDAAATLGDGFACIVSNVGSGLITIDANGAETIRDFGGSAATKTLAQGEAGLLYGDGTGFFLMKVVTPGSSPTLASLGAIFNARTAKTGAYTVVAGDKGVLIDATSGTWSLALTAAATLGDGFNFAVFNSGSGVVTVDPNGAETIRDATSSAATKTLAQGEGGIIVCNGTDFYFFKVTAGGGGTALSTTYSNATSGLAATTVQAALDEIVTRLGGFLDNQIFN